MGELIKNRGGMVKCFLGLSGGFKFVFLKKGGVSGVLRHRFWVSLFVCLYANEICFLCDFLGGVAWLFVWREVSKGYSKKGGGKRTPTFYCLSWSLWCMFVAGISA